MSTVVALHLNRFKCSKPTPFPKFPRHPGVPGFPFQMCSQMTSEMTLYDESGQLGFLPLP